VGLNVTTARFGGLKRNRDGQRTLKMWWRPAAPRTDQNFGKNQIQNLSF